MEGNLAGKIWAYSKTIKDFYSELRNDNLDLFVFDTSYLTILHDRARVFDKNDSVKLNKGDLEELSENIPLYGVNHEMKIREGLLKPLREIYWFELSAFTKKGINKLLDKKSVILPENLASVLANNYR